MHPIIAYIRNNKLAFTVGICAVIFSLYLQLNGRVCFSCAKESRYTPTAHERNHK